VREVVLLLLDADVNYQLPAFPLKKVKEKALGDAVYQISVTGTAVLSWARKP